jgi:3',5'-cyclic AMP phosphodiesterase CpdA
MRRIAHLSDLHFGTEASGVLDELDASLAKFAPHLVIVTGDLTQRARSSQFRRARDFLDRLPFARVVVPGNHDIAPLYQPLERVLWPYARYRRFITHELDHVWHDDELLVLGLSSVQPWRWKEGTVSERQLDWMVTAAQRHPRQVRILAAHHPMVRASTARPTRRLHRHDSLVSALDTAGIGICLSGHLHKSYSGLDEPGSVLAVHASTATSTRLRGQANAYNQLTIDGQTVQVDAVAWNGRGFQRLTSDRYERLGGIWQQRR